MSTSSIVESLASAPLSTPEHVQTFVNHVVNLVRDPAFPTYEIPFRLAPVVAANPSVAEPLFSSLAQMGAKLSCSSFVDALLDSGHEEALLKCLPSMGAIDPDNVSVVDRLCTRLVGRSGPLLQAYIQGWPQRLMWSQAFERIALALPVEQLPDVFTLIATHAQPDRWPSRFFSAILATHGVAALPALTKNRSAYAAAALHADTICTELKTNANTQVRADGFLSVLIGDAAFSSLPTASHSAVLRATTDLTDDEAARALLLAFFSRVKADRGLHPTDTAIQRLSRGIPAPEQAAAIIQNWCVDELMPYTFTGELLAHLLSCVSAEAFPGLFWKILQVTKSKTARTDMLANLARSNPHQFALTYLKNRNRIHPDKYDRETPEAKGIYKLCMEHLSFLDRLLLSFGLM